MILGIAHLAIAVEKMEPSLKFWKEDLGLQLTKIEEVKSEGVKTAFLCAGENPDCHIELLEGTSAESPVSKFVKNRGGGGIHHIAFLVDDVKKEIARLKSCGYQFVNAVPRPGAKGSQVAFLHPKSCFGVLVELVQPSTC